jgi:hypothetical protein
MTESCREPTPLRRAVRGALASVADKRRRSEVRGGSRQPVQGFWVEVRSAEEVAQPNGGSYTGASMTVPS